MSLLKTMSTKPGNLVKSKLTKKTSTSKSPSNVGSLYSGIASAQRARQKPGSAYSVRSIRPKRVVEPTVILPPENLEPPVLHHLWDAQYHQSFTREKLKKSMTKDSYISIIQSFAHATESTATEDECCSILIPTESVQIEKPTIQKSTGPILSDTVRYLRSNDLLPSKRTASRTSLTKSTVSEQQLEPKITLPVIQTKNKNGTARISSTLDRLLNRSKIRNDATAIRRPPRRLIKNVTYETIMPLAVYG